MNENLFVISDIHGCRRELTLLLDNILKMYRSPSFVFVGDYVDRGEDSKGVVDDLLNLSKDYRCIFLMGNHEDMLLDRVTNENKFGSRWDRNGNEATISSYGGLQNILKVHGGFYTNLKLSYEIDGFLFVHGGLKPGLEETSRQEMLWIRDEFIYSDYDFGKIVIYGHTPSYPIRITYKKICVDTGCVYGGYLTALNLNNFEALHLKLGEKKIDFQRLDRNTLRDNNIIS